MSDHDGSENLVELSFEGPNPASELTIYDHSFKPLQSGIGKIEARLPIGLYDLEVSIANQRERKSISLLDPLTVGANEWDIKASTAAPISGPLPARDLHEEKARLHSRAPTLNPAILAGDCRLFIFFRTVRRDRRGELQKPTQRFWSGFKLRARDGRLVSEFADGVRSHVEEGWCAVTVDLAEGCYILSGPGAKDEEICVPLWLQPLYETQLFVPVEDGHPIFDGLTLTMAPKSDGFDPQKQGETEYAAALLAGFRRGENLMNPALVRGMLDNKFYNPFAGIVAVHGLLRMKEPDRQLLRQVIDNLRATLGNHPDVVALELISRQSSDAVLTSPPILRLSLDGVLARSASEPEIIEVNALVSDVLGTLFPAQYVLWRRTPASQTPLLHIVKDWFWTAITAAPGFFKFFRGGESRTVKVNLDATISAFESWLKDSDANALANQLGLPRSIIDRVIKLTIGLLPAAHKLAQEPLRDLELPSSLGGVNHLGAAFLSHFSRTASTANLSTLDRRVIELVIQRWENFGGGRETVLDAAQCQRRLTLLASTVCKARDLLGPNASERGDAMIAASILAGLAARLYPFLLVGHEYEIVVAAGAFAESTATKGKIIGSAAGSLLGPAFEQTLKKYLFGGWLFSAKAEEFVPVVVNDGTTLEFLRLQENYWAAEIDITNWPVAKDVKPAITAPREESVDRSLMSLTCKIEKYAANLVELVRVSLDPLGPTRPALESLPAALKLLREQLQQQISEDRSEISSDAT